jgi:hypothetical protein
VAAPALSGRCVITGGLMVLAVVGRGDLDLAVQATQEDNADHDGDERGDQAGVLVHKAAVLGLRAVITHD